MKTLLKIIGIIILLIIAYAIIAMLAFSKDYHFEKSIVINASKEKVWQHAGSLKGFNTWNPFAKADKNVVITYSGTSGQVGESYHWKGNDQVGEGEQTVIESVPNEKLTSQLHFIKPWEGEAKGSFILTPEGNGTKVTWAMDNELTPMMKLMKPMMDNQMGKMFGQGLEDLKKLSEQ
ncbi:SRPBCC family protein [Chryseobacterium daecheongense]|uniref:SRPBCC family protein n=1 Tax=Chryseobacterium daecheongense TaxID=192389 RepID=UPI001FD63E02|nr:SRPBCC family protein [Chryseobacterium daecheongense]UOV00095.1 SRPBCC family protein [Chryseobacterium daecheongense]